MDDIRCDKNAMDNMPLADPIQQDPLVNSFHREEQKPMDGIKRDEEAKSNAPQEHAAAQAAAGKDRPRSKLREAIMSKNNHRFRIPKISEGLMPRDFGLPATPEAWAYSRNARDESFQVFYGTFAEEVYKEREVDKLTKALANSNPDAFRKAAMSLLASMTGDSVLFTEVLKTRFAGDMHRYNDAETSIKYCRALKEAHGGTLAILEASRRLTGIDIAKKNEPKANSGLKKRLSMGREKKGKTTPLSRKIAPDED